MKKSVKNSKRISINVNISNRWLYTLILVGIVLIAGAGFFTASLLSSSGAIPLIGHPINQTAPPKGCQPGQVLQWTGANNNDGGWACGTSSAGNNFAHMVVFTSTTTWTKPAGVNDIVVMCVGGGGGGGGSRGHTCTVGRGGGGGGMIVGRADVSGTSSLTVTVGGGGAGSTVTGGTGGSSSVSWTAGSTAYAYTATGGTGGGTYWDGTPAGTGGSFSTQNIPSGVPSNQYSGGSWYYGISGGGGGSGSVGATGCNSASGAGGVAAGYLQANQWNPLYGATTYPSTGGASVTITDADYTDKNGNVGNLYGGGGSGAVGRYQHSVQGSAGASGICIIYY